MKKTFTILAIIISLTSVAQKKDTSKVKAPPVSAFAIKPDSVTILMNQFLAFLQDKITVKDYLPVQDMVNAFLKSKELLKPQK